MPQLELQNLVIVGNEQSNPRLHVLERATQIELPFPLRMTAVIK